MLWQWVSPDILTEHESGVKPYPGIQQYTERPDEGTGCGDTLRNEENREIA